MSCPPPLSDFPPGLFFQVEEHVIDNRLPPDEDTFDAVLGPYQDPFDGPVENFYNYSANTVAQDKTLTLVGPVPITITWTHHIIVYDPFSHNTSSESVTLTAASPEYTWPTGTDSAGGSVYDDSFVAHRAV